MLKLALEIEYEFIAVTTRAGRSAVDEAEPLKAGLDEERSDGIGLISRRKLLPQSHPRLIPVGELDAGRFDGSLLDTVVWTSLLDKIAEEMAALPSMSKREVNIALGQLDRVTDELKRAVEQMDAIYNNRTKEEAAS